MADSVSAPTWTSAGLWISAGSARRRTPRRVSAGAVVRVEARGSVAEQFVSAAEAGGSSADVHGSVGELFASAVGCFGGRSSR
ncbi:hypothetical protein [Kitasatospora sp. NE20-6]|uniref:hypothetical protein n=1 Tax=Kitasatospora sp. NE20-6 TaxID=2859066 RepID=UPI0038B273B1